MVKSAEIRDNTAYLPGDKNRKCTGISVQYGTFSEMSIFCQLDKVVRVIC